MTTDSVTASVCCAYLLICAECNHTRGEDNLEEYHQDFTMLKICANCVLERELYCGICLLCPVDLRALCGALRRQWLCNVDMPVTFRT